MSILSPISNRIYLAGIDVRLNGNEECKRYIITQSTTKKVIKNLEVGLELIFKNGQLLEAYDYEDGERFSRFLMADEKAMPYIECEPHPLLVVSANPKGLHQLGGIQPNTFITPENFCRVPFQYLGFITNEDPYLSWLPFPIHLTCPVFLDIDQVFLDYTNPLRPVLLDRQQVESLTTAYEYLNSESEIVYQALRFDFKEKNKVSEIGQAGVPIWFQYPTIPTCPRSGKVMKFVCQLHGGTPVEKTNVKLEDSFHEHFYDELNFFGGGSLYVFFEPESKIACYLIQTT